MAPSYKLSVLEIVNPGLCSKVASLENEKNK